MSLSADINQFHMTPEDLSDLKRDLLATVYNETHAQLLLCQRGTYRKAAKKINSTKIFKNSSITEYKESMLPPEILDDIKLDKELDALRNIYKVAYEELTKTNLYEENPYGELIKAISDQQQTHNEVEILISELKENKSALKELEDRLKKGQSESTEKLFQKLQSVKDLRDQLKNIKRINCLELRLVEKWESNRLTQAAILCEREERQRMKEILDIQGCIAGEQRLICEIESFRNNEISEINDKIAHWEEKFRVENGEITKTNILLTQDIAEIVKSHEKHQAITEERKIFVAEYFRQKEEEQRLYEKQRYRVECAIRIQSWWRGVMVRKGLGPYRKKSKKGKKSKSKK